jgi:hypothetical protein
MCLVRSLTGRDEMQGFSNFLGKINPSESRKVDILLPKKTKCNYYYTSDVDRIWNFGVINHWSA